MPTFTAFDAHYNGANWARSQKWPRDLAASSMDEAIAEVEAAAHWLAPSDVAEGVIVVEYDDDGDEVAEEVVGRPLAATERA